MNSPMTSMPSFAMSGGSGAASSNGTGSTASGPQAPMSPMSSLSAAASNPSPGGGMSPMGMSVGVGMSVGPSPGPACLQQRDNGYSCAVGVGRATGYEPLHLGYAGRPSCSPTQPYAHVANAQYAGHHQLHNHHVGASSTGECLPHSLHSLLAL